MALTSLKNWIFGLHPRMGNLRKEPVAKTPAPLSFEQLIGGPLDGLTVEAKEISSGMCEVPAVYTSSKLRGEVTVMAWRRAKEGTGVGVDAYVTYKRADDGRMKHKNTRRVSFK